MVLKLEHIAAMKINWEPKSKNIEELLNDLNLGQDSCILLDDNPIECAEVETALTDVLAIEMATDDLKIGQFIDSSWDLDISKVSETDTTRTEKYKEEFARQNLKKTLTSHLDFIKGIGLELEFHKTSLNDIEGLTAYFADESI